MRTRQRSYPSPASSEKIELSRGKRRCLQSPKSPRPSKIPRAEAPATGGCPFDDLPEDLLISIIAAVSSSATRPAHLISAALACRRFSTAAAHPQVLAAASLAALGVRAAAWSPGAHRFLKTCSDAGNVEASYVLGVIRFYCLGNRGGGASLMAKAAMASHAPALHSLAVIQFNGSGGSRRDKDLKAGVALCARAASLGHIDAMRELGHCLQDGYGVSQNIPKGRGLLLEANTREAAAAISQTPRRFVEAALQVTAKSGAAMACLHHHLHFYCAAAAAAQAQAQQQPPSSKAPKPDHHQIHLHLHPQQQQQQQGRLSSSSALVPSVVSCRVMSLLQGGGCSLLSDFGCNVPPRKLHVANRFLVDWFSERAAGAGLRLCSHANCGRPETRRHEFRRCSACGCVNYCSRACQALDWKIRHKFDCSPVVDWEDRDANLGPDAAAAAPIEEQDDIPDEPEEPEQLESLEPPQPEETMAPSPVEMEE